MHERTRACMCVFETRSWYTRPGWLGTLSNSLFSFLSAGIKDMTTTSSFAYRLLTCLKKIYLFLHVWILCCVSPASMSGHCVHAALAEVSRGCGPPWTWSYCVESKDTGAGNHTQVLSKSCGCSSCWVTAPAPKCNSYQPHSILMSQSHMTGPSIPKATLCGDTRRK